LFKEITVWLDYLKVLILILPCYFWTPIINHIFLIHHQFPTTKSLVLCLSTCPFFTHLETKRNRNWSSHSSGMRPLLSQQEEFSTLNTSLYPLILFFSFFLFYCSFIHMCIHCLGHFSPLPPTSTLSPQTPVASRYNLFCPYVEFGWREDISIRKTKCFC
jgi:hypothetical protein